MLSRQTALSRNLILTIVLLLCLLTAIGHTAYFYPHLPARVATHFDGQGEPNGFSSKIEYSLLMLGSQSAVCLLFLGLGPLVKVLPVSLVNLPNREYWLAPERKAETVKRVNFGMLIMGISTLLFLMAIDHLICLHNLGVPAMNWTGVLVAGYIAGSLAFCIWFCFQFPKPGSGSTPAEKIPDGSPTEPSSAFRNQDSEADF